VELAARLNSAARDEMMADYMTVSSGRTVP